jgi:hypothetical protein
LRDRRGIALTFDDIEHYARIVGVVSATIAIMNELDALVPAWPLGGVPLSTAS